MAKKQTSPSPKPKRQREPRLKQQVIPGSEPERIKVIDEAADIYYEAMMDRVALSREEDKAKDNLINKMLEHHITRYETRDGLIVDLTDKKNIRVKRKKDERDDNGDGIC